MFLENSVPYGGSSFSNTVKYYSFSQINKWKLRDWGACPRSPKGDGSSVNIIGFPVSQIHVDSLLYSSLWMPYFSISTGTFESFPIKTNLYLRSCSGQLLFRMHVLLITMSYVSIAPFSEKIQAHSRRSSLISSDSMEAGLE